MARRYRCESSDPTEFHFCEDCFQKQLKIDKLKTENEYLKAQLRYRKKKDKQEFFGSSTPSSKLKFKKNADKERERKRGGGKKGHRGYGRKLWGEEEADVVIDL